MTIICKREKVFLKPKGAVYSRKGNTTPLVISEEIPEPEQPF